MALSDVACAAQCGTPMDAALIEEGLDAHPGCRSDFPSVTYADVIASQHARNREFYTQHGAYEMRGKWLMPTPKCPPGSSSKLWLPRGGGKAREAAKATAQIDGWRTLNCANDRAAQIRAAIAALPRSGTRRREVYDGHVIRAPMMREGSSGQLQEVYVALVNVPEEHVRHVREQDHGLG